MILAGCLALGAYAAARDVTALSIDAATGEATVTIAAGEPGDGHVLYYVWSNDGYDKGGTLAAWPNVVRLGRVADDATSYSFTLPAVAAPTARYAARAILATSDRNYDNLVEGVTSSGDAYVNTGITPQGGKTAVTVDFKFASATSQYYIFGTWKSTVFSFCAYINGDKKWAYACKKSESPWTATTCAASSKRTVLTLDSVAPRYSVSNDDGSIAVTPSGVGTTTTTYPIYLFGRNNGGTFDKKTPATIYSCVITNNGACVRNYRPAVKDGVAGLYDYAYNTFTGSGNSTALSVVGGTNLTYEVDSGDMAVAASPVWPTSTTTPPDYVIATPPYEDSGDRSFVGGSKSGTAPLVLSGANDWGGTFTVNEGALIADFGQGLAATDNLVFNGGTYGLLSGNTFNWTIGTGGGETSIGADITKYGFTALSSSILIDYPLFLLNRCWDS